MTNNSPSGKRSAVGRSIIPGKPKLPADTRCVSLSAKWGKNKDAAITMSEIALFIIFLI